MNKAAEEIAAVTGQHAGMLTVLSAIRRVMAVVRHSARLLQVARFAVKALVFAILPEPVMASPPLVAGTSRLWTVHHVAMGGNVTVELALVYRGTIPMVPMMTRIGLITTEHGLSLCHQW